MEKIFSGEYIVNVDAKGRIIIPQKLRNELDEGFVITKGLNHCAFILQKKKFDMMESELSNLPFTNKNARQMQVFFLGSKIDGEFDSVGRVSLSQMLREYAKLQKEAVVVGAGSRIEIWDKQSYKDFVEEATDSDEFMEGIADINLV